MRMRKLLVLAFALLCSAWVLSASPERACAGGTCGIMPLKPLTPLGCTNLCPSCQCDSRGQNCSWVWVCC